MSKPMSGDGRHQPKGRLKVLRRSPKDRSASKLSLDIGKRDSSSDTSKPVNTLSLDRRLFRKKGPKDRDDVSKKRLLHQRLLSLVHTSSVSRSSRRPRSHIGDPSLYETENVRHFQISKEIKNLWSLIQVDICDYRSELSFHQDLEEAKYVALDIIKDVKEYCFCLDYDTSVPLDSKSTDKQIHLKYSDLNWENYLAAISKAQNEVKDLLDRVSILESLYPSIRLLCKEHPSYSRDFDFREKSDFLILWYNLMNRLLAKLHEMRYKLRVDSPDWLIGLVPFVEKPIEDSGVLHSFNLLFEIENGNAISTYAKAESWHQISVNPCNVPPQAKELQNTDIKMYLNFVIGLLKQSEGALIIPMRVFNLVATEIFTCLPYFSRVINSHVDMYQVYSLFGYNPDDFTVWSSKFLNIFVDGTCFEQRAVVSPRQLENLADSDENFNLIESVPVSVIPLAKLNERYQLPSLKPLLQFMCKVPFNVMRCTYAYKFGSFTADSSPIFVHHQLKDIREFIEAGIVLKKLSSTLSQEFGIDLDFDEFSDRLESLLEFYIASVLNVLKNLITLPLSGDRIRFFLDREWKFVKTVTHDGEIISKFCINVQTVLTPIFNILKKNLDSHFVAMEILTANRVIAPQQTGEFQKCLRKIRTQYKEEEVQVIHLLKFVKQMHLDLGTCISFIPILPQANLFDILKADGYAKIRFLATDTSSGSSVNGLQNQVNHINHYGFIKTDEITDDFEKDVIDLLSSVTKRHVSVGKSHSSSKFTFKHLVIAPSFGESSWNGKVVSVQLIPRLADLIADLHQEDQTCFLIVPPDVQSNYRFVERIKLTFRCQAISLKATLYRRIAHSLQSLIGRLISLSKNYVDLIKDNSLKVIKSCKLANLDRASPQYSTAKSTVEQMYSMGFNFLTTLGQLLYAEERQRIASSMNILAQLWLDYVTINHGKGKGVVPAWAKYGVKFLFVSINDDYLTPMDRLSTNHWIDKVNNALNHIIGEDGPSSSEKSPAMGLSPYYDSEMQAKFSTTIKRTSSRCGHGRQLQIINACQELDSQRRRKQRQSKYSRLCGEVRRNPELRRRGMKWSGKEFNWTLGSKLGSGSFGVVHYCNVNDKSLTGIAVKEIIINLDTKVCSIDKIVCEYDLIQQLDHEHITKYYRIEIHEVIETKVLLFMEYCEGGSLGYFSKTNNGLPEGMARCFTKQLTLGLDYLHSKNILHRDIKADNVFMTDNFKIIKLGDFGLCLDIAKKEKTCDPMLQRVPSMQPGTFKFMPPETFSNECKWTKSSEIWCIGCVLIEMITGNDPWPGMTAFTVIFKVGCREIPVIPSNLSADGKLFLESCFQYGSQERPTTTELLLDCHYLNVPKYLSEDDFADLK